MSDQLQECGERVSALVDGQLVGDEFAQALDFLADTPEAHRTWDTYHLVGEAMRSAGVPMRAHDPDFVARLRLRLAEDTPEVIAASPDFERATGINGVNIVVANDRWWKRLVGMASIAMVGVLAWQGMALMGSGVGRPSDASLAQLAASRSQAAPVALVTADGASALMIRDPQLDALLAAHRQVGSATALQMSSGFLRNATFDEGKR